MNWFEWCSIVTLLLLTVVQLFLSAKQYVATSKQIDILQYELTQLLYKTKK